MQKREKVYYFETLLYLFIGILVCILPMFIHVEEKGNWSFIFHEWQKLIPFFIIFLLNNFILAPKLLLKDKYPAYVILSVLLLLTVTMADNILHKPKHSLKHKEFRHEPSKRDSRVVPFERGGEPRNPDRVERPLPPLNVLKHRTPHPPLFNFGVFLVGLLIIGFNSGVKIFVRWINTQDEFHEKEKYLLNAELAFLKHQISPHFFMNTLNNIHALVDIDGEKAKDAIIKLSHLMRYLLYEADNEKTSLQKELKFLENYIELMRLRYDEKILTIRVSYHIDRENVQVPSLLFLPLIENSFKHGVRPSSPSFIDIQLTVNEKVLTIAIKNSYFPKKETSFSESSGIGLENIRKRLTLLYEDQYSFTFHSDHTQYETTLSIPVT